MDFNMKRKKFKDERSIYEVPKIEIIEVVLEQGIAASWVTGTGDDYEVDVTGFYDPYTHIFKK